MLLAAATATCAQNLADDLYFYGDLRARVYHSDPLLLPETQAFEEDGWFADTRTRVTAALQFSDAFSAQLTLQWNTQLSPEQNDSDNVASIGAYNGEWDRFGIGPSEIAWNNILFSPYRLRAGRTAILFDEGLLFSAEQGAWLLDHIALEYDTPALKIVGLYGSVSWLAPETDIREFAFLHGSRNNPQPSRLPTISGYAGTLRMRDNGQPVMAGLHTTLFRSRSWKMYFEAAGETGTRPHDQSLLAGITDAGLVYEHITSEKRTASLSTRWTFATGDAQPDGRHAFIPLFNYEDWGCVFSPQLSNIHILSLKTELPVWRAITLHAAAYSYFQARINQGRASRANFNNGGYTPLTDGNSRELGSEIDAALEYLVSPDLRIELVGGYFIRGSAYAQTANAQNASEISLQATLRF
jgi:hypothetical protein